jgi:hypothetical protein
MKRRRNSLESIATVQSDCQHEVGQDGPLARPLSLAWITDELVAETRQVLGRAYGRELTDADAVEILTNVKRLADTVLRAEVAKLRVKA